MRRLSGLLTLVVLLPLASGQEWAKKRLESSPRHLEFVKVKQGERQVETFLAFPEVKTKATAVVVIHEIFGLSDWVRSLSDQLAENGYIAIAPDLLTGLGPKGGGTAELGGPDGARKAIGKLPADQITADLQAVIEYAAKLPACNGKVVVAGFCWGGGQSFRIATNNKNIKAAFVFYGGSPSNEEDIKRIACPVHGFYAMNDMRINASLPKTAELMKSAGKSFEYEIYDGAGHGFMRAGDDPAGSKGNKAGRDKAWDRWKKLLEKI